MNYPDNVNPNSKECPWNQKEPVICEDCDGRGYYIEIENNEEFEIKCENCNGEGIINDEE